MIIMKMTWYRYRIVLIGLILSGNMCAVADTGESVSRLFFTAKCNGTGVSDDGAKWTITSDGQETTFDATNGIKYIKNSKSGNTISYLRLSSNEIAGTIREVKVTACTEKNMDYYARITVSVGGTPFQCGSNNFSAINSTSNSYHFTGEGIGEVLVLISQTASTNSIYCKSIEVTHQASRTISSGDEWSVEAASRVEELVIEKEGTVTLSNKILTVKGDLVIRADRETGTSGQLKGAESGLLTILGDAYMEITLGADADPNKWHGIAVPFPVSARDGFYSVGGRKLVYDEDYAVMVYDGAARADGLYGWKKEEGTLMPGVFYMVTVDGREPVLKLKKLRESAVVTAAEQGYRHYTGAGSEADAGWNGMGNPTIAYRKVNMPIQIFDENAYVFRTCMSGSETLAVGTPFFYQAANEGTMSFEYPPSALPAPARQETGARNMVAEEQTEYRKIAFGDESYTDYLYVAAYEQSQSGMEAVCETYSIGRDLVKMRMTESPSVPQITAVSKGERLCMAALSSKEKEIICPLELYAPQDGRYVLRDLGIPSSTSGMSTRDEEVYLLRDAAIVGKEDGQWTLSLTKGNHTEFSLRIVGRSETTPIPDLTENNKNETPQKLLIGGKMLIRIGEKIYGLTGERIQ